jgi:ATP-dependent RNA helicase RhlE
VVFSELGLSPQLAAGVAALGYVQPTPIQQMTIPSILSGRDVMGLAQTGTGKTAAFALPILQRLEQSPRGRTRALVVAPTRELADQIRQAFADLGRHSRLRSVAIYGGVGFGSQIEALRRGTEIVVACPGRLLDHIRQGNVDLSGVEVLVLDEADRMFDMGFLPDVRTIIRALPTARQTLLFSATMPDDVRLLTSETLKDPVVVEIGHAAPVETVSHAVYPVQQHLKTALLMDLLLRTGPGQVLVFTRTKHRAKRVAEQLEAAGFPAASLQGNLSQSRREAALGGFRQGRYRVLVATDIAARGIDVSGISHVINYDMPETTDAYTHRIGRTGRAERLGDAYTLVTSEDATAVRDIERVVGHALERRYVEGFDYAAPGQNQRLEFARPPQPRRQNAGAGGYNGRQPVASVQARPPAGAAAERQGARPFDGSRQGRPTAAPHAAGNRPSPRPQQARRSGAQHGSETGRRATDVRSPRQP